MNDEYARSLFRLHCLNRLAKLQDKIEQPNWEMSVEREIGLLMHVQVNLTVILHELGIECFIAEDLETAERLERPS